ncbi:MAG: TetR/AcrR family transcriptional regulator [Myxococcaceae bacterium]|nr:TetR/AcrR family transcriptional regulator [Myxococcaceae bacterium]
MARKRKRSEQRDVTRARFVAVAKGLFTEAGYDGTSIAMVCRRARVTHGALYHHFPGKLQLFEAVLEQVTAGLVEGMARAVAGAKGLERIERALDAYLTACGDPSVQAVLLRDGPRVLERAKFDAIDHAANEPFVTGLLQAAIDEGVLRPHDVKVVGRVIGAACAEAGVALAGAEDRDAVRREVKALFSGWLSSLKK